MAFGLAFAVTYRAGRGDAAPGGARAGTPEAAEGGGERAATPAGRTVPVGRARPLLREAAATTEAVARTTRAAAVAAATATMRFAQATCDVEARADFIGDALVWGPNNVRESVEECARQCAEHRAGDANKQCNAFVYCPADGEPCSGMTPGSCWLKRSPVTLADDATVTAPGARGARVSWTSGGCATAAERAALRDATASVAAERRQRRDDPRNPRVEMAVSVRGDVIGTASFVLYATDSPNAAENFRLMCTGELGRPYTFANAPFYRIIDAFINQAGVAGAQAAVAPYRGRAFPDDAGGLKLKHDRPGLLSLANAGPNTNTGHFSVVMAPAPHLDGSYTIFGELLSGMDTMRSVNALAGGRETNAAAGARIESCKQV